MKIESMKIKNFRGYKDETEIKFNDLTVLIGKNDIGKSTILEALDIFFNDGKGAVAIDKTDVNIENLNNGNQEIIISVCFTDLPEKIIIDSIVDTNLNEEYMLNEDGNLEIIKKYKNGGTPKIYIRALHPTNEKCNELLIKKNDELKKIIKKENIECDNLIKNSNLRKAIWKHYEENLNLQNVEIDVSKEDAKKIWEKLYSYLPIYSLFQSDRKNSDNDSEVQDPLKEAVKQIITDEQIQNSLSNIAEFVQNKLQDVADRTLEKLNEMDPSVADTLHPVIPSVSSLKWHDVFKNVSISGDGDIPINKRGSGVKRLVLLNFFRAEAERLSQSEEQKGVIYAIEEPETAQHSNNQLMLIDSFKTMVASNNVQIILTTHSSNIVKQLDYNNLRLIKNENNVKKILEVKKAQLQYPSLNEVNYIAFDEITEEYHDELYSFIEFHKLRNKYIQNKPQMDYIRQKNDNLVTEKKVLTEYIRHQIHHPENHHNQRYTKEQLKHSIEMMRNFIYDTRHNDGITEP